MKFELGNKVKMTQSKTSVYGNSPAGKGIVVGIFLLNGNVGADVYLQVRLDNNAIYNYDPKAVTLLRTQTLHAYTDQTNEVHWATKQYSDKELVEFGYKKASEYNKTIDLE